MGIPQDWRFVGQLGMAFVARGLVQHRLRTALTCIGVALGVAIVLAIQLANHSAVERFRQSIEAVSGKTVWEIRADSAPTLDERLLENLNGLAHFNGQWSPVFQELALVWPQTAQASGEISAGDTERLRKLGEPVTILGLDGFADTAFRPYDWATDIDGGGEPEQSTAIFTTPCVYITQSYAQQHGLKRNAMLSVFVGQRLTPVRVVGIIADKGLAKGYDGRLLLMDIGQAQQLFGQQGRVHRVDVWLPKAQHDAGTAWLQRALPQGISLVAPDNQSKQGQRMLRAFQLNLTAVSFIALMVSFFLIYNTTMVSVVRRQNEYGMLRAVGASVQQVGLLTLLEATVQGIIGSGLGVALGCALAFWTVSGISSTVETLYTGMPIEGVVWDAGLIVACGLLGIGMSLVAALPSWWHVCHITPIQAIRQLSLQDDQGATVNTNGAANTSPVSALWQQWPVRLFLLGLGLVGVACFTSTLPPVDGFPVFGHVTSFLAIMAFACTIPLGAQLLLGGALRLVPPNWLSARLALTLMQRSLGRMAVAIASLMVAVGMVVSLSVMIASFRETVTVWVNQSIKADLWIEPLWRKRSVAQTFDMSVMRTIEGIPGVAFADPFYEYPITFRDQPAFVATARFPIIADRGQLLCLSGRSSRAVVQEAIDREGFLVTEAFAYRHHLNPGDMLTLSTPKGPLTRPIIDAYRDYASEYGHILINRAVYDRYYDASRISGLAVFLKPGQLASTIRDRIQSTLGTQQQLSVMTQAGLRADVMRIFDETFAITYALHLIAITVAVLGVMNTLFMVVMAEQRTFGLLKALGASRRMIMGIVMLMAFFVAVAGLGFGAGLGAALSQLLIQVVNKQSFGWSIAFDVPWRLLATMMSVLVGVALFGAIVPGRMASRALPPSALRA